MFNESEQAQFEDWQKKWDAASEQMAKDFAEDLAKKGQKPAQEQPATSWLTNTPMDRDYKQSQEIEEEPSWRDIYYRSQNIGGLITEAGVKFDKGETKPNVSFGGFTPTKTNPTTQSSVGPDGVGPDGHVRVTPNWSDGDDLRELDDIKRRLETMERKHHKEEVMSEKPAGGLKKQLESLRDRVQKLSEKINRSPEVDVS